MDTPIIFPTMSSTEEYISKVCTPMTYQDCLQKADYDDYGKFAGALACIFDVDPKVIGQISNLDFLTPASIKKDEPVNYIQWVAKRDNIDEVIHYLFMRYSPSWNEEYEHTSLDRERIDRYIDTVVTDCYYKHPSPLQSSNLSLDLAKEYIRWLAVRFWQDPDIFLDENDCYIKYIAKAFAPYIADLIKNDHTKTS